MTNNNIVMKNKQSLMSVDDGAILLTEENENEKNKEAKKEKILTETSEDFFGKLVKNRKEAQSLAEVL